MLLRAYGRLISVSGPASVLEDVRSRLPPTYRAGRGEPDRRWEITSDDDGRWRVSAGDSSLGTRPSIDAAVVTLLSDLELWVGANAEARIFIHAGCVVHDGRAIILPGRSMAGKTTLTLALVEAGARYFSDEYAVIDAEGRVHPYRRRPAVRPGSPFAGHDLAPEATDDPDQAVPVGLSALVTYRPESDWEMECDTAAAGVLHLMSNTLPARTRTVEALASFARLAETATFRSGTRGEAADAARHLLALLADPANA